MSASECPAASEATDDSVLFRLRHLRRVFKPGQIEIEVLKDLSLDLRRAEVSVILGPSGAGKSTILNLLGALDRPSSGQIHYEGVDIAALSEHERDQYRRSQVGFVFQFYNLIASLTAEENVALAAELCDFDPGPKARWRPRKARDPRETLDLVGLSDRADHFPAQLSGGEQQRVAIARAIVTRPRVILCDEPTGALDARTGRKVLAVLAELCRSDGLSLVIITHNSPIAEMAHQVLRLAAGGIAESWRNEQPRDPGELDW